MADRSIRVILRAEINDFKAKIAQAEQSIKRMAGQAEAYVERNSAQIDGMSNRLGVAGAALTALGALAVSKFADFDQAMSKVAATGDDARASLDGLRDAAIEAGARTQFSATEAAGGIEALAKAGVSAADILGGGLDGALDLAAAGNLDVAASAETAAIAMAQFGLAGDDVSHVADLLAAGAGKANGEVSDMAMALKQSGQVASMTGLTIEETTAALAAFANAGLLGSDAGTSLKTMLQRLSAPTADVKSEMDALGISAYDASGNFVGLDAFAGQLQSSLEDLTPAQRNAALATIFGSDAVRAATVLYNEGADGVRDWTQAVDDQGYAAEVAAIQMDNLKGDIEQLGGSVETALIKLGESGNGPLRSLTQGATNLVNALSDAPGPIQAVTLALVGGGGLVLLGAAGLGKLVTSINEAKAAMKALEWTAKGTSITVGLVSAALGVAALGIMAWANRAAEAKARTEELQSSLSEFGVVTDETMSRINDVLSKDRNDWLDNLFGDDPESLIDKAEQFGLTVRDLQGYILDEADAIDRVTAATDSYIQSKEGANSATRRLAEESVNQLIGPLNAERDALTDAQKAQSQKALADYESADSAGVAKEATEDATEAYVDQEDRIQDLIDALDELNGRNVSVEESTINYMDALAAVDEAIAKNGKTTDLTTEAGRRNRDVLLQLRDAAAERAEAILEQTGNDAMFAAELERGRQALHDAAVEMGMSEEQAWDYVDSLLAIPPTRQTQVTAPGLTETQQKVQNLVDLLKRLDGTASTVTVYNRVVDVKTGVAISGPQGQQRAMNRGGLVGLAGGGLVPGTPPADPREDNVLATGPGGLIALRSGEFVSTEESTRRNLTALRAGNRGAALVVAGYAAGGQVHAAAPAAAATSAHAAGAAPAGPVDLSEASVWRLAAAMKVMARQVGDSIFDDAARSREGRGGRR